MALLKTSTRRSAHRDDPHVWTDEEVSQLLWAAVALRHKQDPLATKFWDAVEIFSLTEDPIESRQLRRVAATTFKCEYGRALHCCTRIVEKPRARRMMEPLLLASGNSPVPGEPRR
jgi:hypothetical protein